MPNEKYFLRFIGAVSNLIGYAQSIGEADYLGGELKVQTTWRDGLLRRAFKAEEALKDFLVDDDRNPPIDITPGVARMTITTQQMTDWLYNLSEDFKGPPNEDSRMVQCIHAYLCSAVVVPDTHKVVPVEPTEAMLLKTEPLWDIDRNPKSSMFGMPLYVNISGMKNMYKAMLAAAPDYPEKQE